MSNIALKVFLKGVSVTKWSCKYVSCLGVEESSCNPGSPSGAREQPGCTLLSGQQPVWKSISHFKKFVLPVLPFKVNCLAHTWLVIVALSTLRHGYPHHLLLFGRWELGMVRLQSIQNNSLVNKKYTCSFQASGCARIKRLLMQFSKPKSILNPFFLFFVWFCQQVTADSVLTEQPVFVGQ